MKACTSPLISTLNIRPGFYGLEEVTCGVEVKKVGGKDRLACDVESSCIRRNTLQMQYCSIMKQLLGEVKLDGHFPEDG